MSARRRDDDPGMRAPARGEPSTQASAAPAEAARRNDGLPDLVCLAVRPESLSTSHGDTVLASGREGWLEGAPETGLFVHQTRLLSTYRMRVGRESPKLAAQSNVRQDRWIGYYLVRAPGQDGGNEPEGPQSAAQQALELRVSRTVGEGMHEDLDLANHTREPVRVRLALELDGDFADLDETKGEREQQGELRRSWRRDGDAWLWRLDYSSSRRTARGGERRTVRIDRALELRIHGVDSPPTRRGGRIGFDIDLEPHGHWHACLDWTAEVDGEVLAVPPCEARGAGADACDRTDARYLARATAFATAESHTLAPVVADTLARSRNDLAALRLERFDQDGDGWTVAAGVPMYVALFGRDTLVTAWQSALLGPELLRGALPPLARLQGRVDDPWRDERPGRIIHEAHRGPLACLEVNPKSRHYGSLTSSALFPLVLGELWDWTADRAAVEPLLPHALAAMDWLDREACDSGFYAWTTTSPKGMKNQTWKDSDDGIVDEAGEPVEHPVAACEEQAFAYAAKRALARLLRAFGDDDRASRLEGEAADLRARFDAAFWCADLGTFAIACREDGSAIRTVASNPLYTLATGLALPKRRAPVVERLFAPDLFTGWGLRTLSSRHPGYNPYAYHRGCVWPVEHGPAALGLYRCGETARLQQLCRAMFETAAMFAHRRLPECFSGHARDKDHPFPALYPAANAPQAWSAATGPAMAQALLGLAADAPAGVLRVDPHLPDWLPTLHVRGLRVGAASVDLHFTRCSDGTTRVDVAALHGELDVRVESTRFADLDS
jgi:glycogen debranching enzyme